MKRGTRIRNGFFLTVRDNGMGIAESLDFRKIPTLGMHLITLLAEEQMNGQILLERDQGTRFRIRFKASRQITES